jgi:hypothetical protein
MTASSSARAMRAPGSGGAVIVAVVSPVVARLPVSQVNCENAGARARMDRALPTYSLRG